MSIELFKDVPKYSPQIHGARKISGHRVREGMEYFHRAPMTLSEGMAKLEELISADNGFGRKLPLLERRLMRMEKNKYLITDALFI